MRKERVLLNKFGYKYKELKIIQKKIPKIEVKIKKNIRHLYHAKTNFVFLAARNLLFFFKQYGLNSGV